MMDEESIMALMELISKLSPGPSPNEGFGVPAPRYKLSQYPIGDSGMSMDSAVMGKGLNDLQRAGVRPPMPAQAGSGPGAKMALIEIIQALREARNLEAASQMQPGDPAVFQSGASVGGEGNRDLLRKLLEGS